MYAVIETGGKQYRVEVGTELEVELLDVEPGQSITLERVLLVADGAEATVGTPVVTDAAVEAEVVGTDRGDKVIAFKYRPKARRRVKKGHRQDYTVLRIADIRFNGKSAAETEAKAMDAKKTERQRLEEAAARQAAEDAALAAKLAVRTAADEAAEPKARAKAADADATVGKSTKPAAKPRRGEASREDGDEAAAKAATKPAPRRRPRRKRDEAGDEGCRDDERQGRRRRATDETTDADRPSGPRTKKDE